MRSRIAAVAALVSVVAGGFAALRSVSAQDVAKASSASGGPATLKIDGAVETALTLTVEDLKNMPRKTVTVMNSHENKKETYEGVLMEELLKKAGVPLGEHLRGKSLAAYVVVTAEDGYRVVFSIAELDAGIVDSDVMVADTLDGAAMAGKVGPLRVVAPREKRPARWVRMVKEITVVKVE